MSAILRGGANRGTGRSHPFVRGFVPKASDDIRRSRCTSKNVKLGFSPGNAGDARRVSVFRCLVTVW
ncbi:hypothetical protein DID96_00345 [Burkholderia sp. Bp8963]|nr:hypothetical protein DID96_00345 [Burkholderia sp. Bp8963]